MLMAIRRRTLPDDEDRFIENFYTSVGRNVKSEEGFEKAYAEYIQGSETEFTERMKPRALSMVSQKNNFQMRERQTTLQEKKRTKKKISQTPRQKHRKFSVVAYRGEQQVFAERVVIKRKKGVVVERLRDSKGRFVSAKRKTSRR